MTLSRWPLMGVDFTSAPSARKPITVAHAYCAADAHGAHLVLLELQAIRSFENLLALLLRPGPWLGVFDFPFGLPRALVSALGWPDGTWDALVAHCAGLPHGHFRAQLDAFRAARPVGDKYVYRTTDHPARASSPMKLVNPPVGLMYLTGAPLLCAADLTVPGLRAGDPQRIALEGYPGMLARAITAQSYKSDTVAEQTRTRHAARERILDALLCGRHPLGLKLVADDAHLNAMLDDGRGDVLDAVLCAVEAGWAWQRRDQGWGLPAQVDALEGWIVGCDAIATARAATAGDPLPLT